MAALHLLSQPPGDVWARLCPRLTGGDQVLLLGEAVYGLHHPQLAQLRDTGAAIAALGPDMSARGIEAAGVAVIDYDGFVDLTAAYAHILSW